MTSAHDNARLEARTNRGKVDHRTWTAPAVRRMSAGIAEAGGAAVSDGMIGQS